jgi:hypothetical protein
MQISMFCLHSDHTRGCACGCRCAVQSPNSRDCPTVLFIGLWPHSSSSQNHVLVQHLSGDATITQQHKRNTNIQELCTLLNTLLLIRKSVFIIKPFSLHVVVRSTIVQSISPVHRLYTAINNLRTGYRETLHW